MWSQESERRRIKSAFTLIELLVVVAIILLLAGILFPVFARARENARRSSCMSNMKQIGLGLMQYAQDNDEKYPHIRWNSGQPTTGPTGTTAGRWYWFDMIYPYVKSKQVFLCPSSTGTNLNAKNYGANGAIIPSNAAGGTPLAALINPSSTYAILETGYTNITPSLRNYDNSFYLAGNGLVGGMSTGTDGCGNLTKAASINDCMNGRHFDGGNIIFADGHVKWLKITKIAQEARDSHYSNRHSSWRINPDPP